MKVVGVIVGILALVAAAEAATEGRLALRSLPHETAGGLRASEATRALRCHAEATDAGLNAGRGGSVPGTGRRLVAELAKGRGCCDSFSIWSWT